MDVLCSSWYHLVMAKVDFRRLGRQEQEALEQELWQSIDAIKRRADLEGFLRDLFTPSEIVMLARRIRIAKQCRKGATIGQVCQELHVGQATAQAVDKWLRSEYKDYRAVFPPLYERATKEKGQRGGIILQGTFKHMRKKYPSHFALFNMLFD